MVKDKKQSLLFVLTFALATLFFLSCKTTNTNTSVAKPPVEQAPQPPAQTALPKLPDPPAQRTLPIIQQKPLVDPVENLIQRSQAYFLQGEKESECRVS